MKRILLPTDFSDNSKNAIDYALQFFKGHPCHFIFLNVQKPSEFLLDDFYTAPATATINETVLKDNKKELELLLIDCREKYPSRLFSFDSITDYDTLTDSISQVVKAEHIDLIIMGSNGATGANEVIFGSNTLKVIHKVDCPVLVIPEGYSYIPIKTLLFSTHNQEFYPDGMQTLKSIIDLKKPKVTVLDIQDGNKEYDPDDELASLELFLERKLDDYYILEHIPVAIAIDAFTQLHPVQLHALFVERKSFLSRFIFGSTTSEISYESRVPLLVLHS
ncbi:universal stress protein [Aureisphaera galaxeae]|uniref:universal stress protein n=1 Tax=Aureisphaera galaxeae TaxID=1538023 RepID=UPI0023502AE0|nr:universal stress protein [Aureisphaera galaxeae]MDC8003787.1 universal stress protein [Aureisphaera galaxeae]